MISVDTRAGSDSLIPLLQRAGLPVTPARLLFGDIRFLGSGPQGEPVTVGVEVKTIHDLLHCITDGRFSGHQLPGMMTAYDQPWLLIMGQWRQQRSSGILQYLSKSYQWRDAHVGSRHFMYRDLLSWITTVRTKVGIRDDSVPDQDHAVAWIGALYSWWTRVKRVGGEEVTGWESHRSHLAVNQASNEQFWSRVKQEERDSRGGNGGRNGSNGIRGRLADPANLLRPTVCRLVAAQLPGVGYTRSEAVAKRFPRVADLVAATEKEIMEVEGLGKVGAKKVWRALHDHTV